MVLVAADGDQSNALSIRELASALRSEMEEQGWLSIHRQAIDDELSARDGELQRVRAEFEQRTEDLIRTQEELRTTSEERVRLEEHLRQREGLEEELNQAKAELRLAANRHEVHELALSARDSALGQVKEELHACKEELRVVRETSRMQADELRSLRGYMDRKEQQLYTAQVDSARLQGKLEQQEVIGEEVRATLRMKEDELRSSRCDVDQMESKLRGFLKQLRMRDADAPALQEKPYEQESVGDEAREALRTEDGELSSARGDVGPKEDALCEIGEELRTIQMDSACLREQLLKCNADLEKCNGELDIARGQLRHNEALKGRLSIVREQRRTSADQATQLAQLLSQSHGELDQAKATLSKIIRLLRWAQTAQCLAFALFATFPRDVTLILFLISMAVPVAINWL